MEAFEQKFYKYNALLKPLNFYPIRRLYLKTLFWTEQTWPPADGAKIT